MDFRNKLKSLVNKDTNGPSSKNSSISKSVSQGHLSTTNNRKASLSSTLSSFRPFTSSSSSNALSNSTSTPSSHHHNDNFEHHANLYAKWKMEKEIRKSSSSRREDPTCFSTLSNNLNNRQEVSQVDKDILATIEPFYFESHVEGDVACQSYIIDKLPPGDQPLDLDYIISEKNRLKKQLSIVTKKVTDVMMTHQGTYFAELQKVVHLQTLLNDAINTCSLARKSLSVSKHNLTVTPLKVIHDFNTSNNLKSLLSEVHDRKNKKEDQEVVEENTSQETLVSQCLVNDEDHKPCNDVNSIEETIITTKEPQDNL